MAKTVVHKAITGKERACIAKQMKQLQEQRNIEKQNKLFKTLLKQDNILLNSLDMIKWIIQYILTNKLTYTLRCGDHYIPIGDIKRMFHFKSICGDDNYFVIEFINKPIKIFKYTGNLSSSNNYLNKRGNLLSSNEEDIHAYVDKYISTSDKTINLENNGTKYKVTLILDKKSDRKSLMPDLGPDMPGRNLEREF